MMTDFQFEKLGDGVTAAVIEGNLRSVYVGLIHKNGQYKYYLSNDRKGAEELRETAAIKLG